MPEGELSSYAIHKRSQLQSDFWGFKGNITRAIERNTPENPTLWIGPEIKVTSGGRSASFKTIILNTGSSASINFESDSPTPTEYEREVYLLGYDHDGRYIGRRFTQIIQKDKKEAITATGGLTLDRRGEGFTRFFEIANTHILQRVSSMQGTPLRQVILDENQENLIQQKQKLVHMKSQDPHPDLSDFEDKIRKMEDEHIRWHKIWGHGGILGFEHASDTSLITKDYFPIRNNPDFLIPLENLEGITLDIDEGYKEGYKIIRPLLTSQTSKPQINLTRELAQIQELVQNEGRLWHE